MRQVDAAAAAGMLGVLPEWDLSDLYSGRDSPALTQDLGRLAADAEAFRRRYEGRLAELTGAEFGAPWQPINACRKRVAGSSALPR